MTEAILALGSMKANDFVADDMVKLLNDDATKSLAKPVGEALGMMGPAVANSMVKMIKSQDASVRVYGALAIAELDSEIGKLKPLEQKVLRAQIVAQLDAVLKTEQNPEAKAALGKAKTAIQP
jgi:hypothetical protein